MYNGLGLRTPRGSGTNGYVQRNLSFAKPKVTQYQTYQYDAEPPPKRASKPSADIVMHQKRRQIEVECLEYEEELLASKEYTLEEVKSKVAELRKQRLQKLEMPERIDRPEKPERTDRSKRLENSNRK